MAHGSSSSFDPEVRSLTTLILAGGRGERLHPLTRDRAKPAVVFGGNYRIIDFTLSNCVNSGIRRVYVLTQYKSISLARHIKLGWNIFPSELREFIEVIPAQQRYGESWYRGTADAIYQNIYTIVRERPEHVLILAGDHVYKMNYLKMFRRHLESDADVTIGIVERPRAEADQLGVVQVDANQKILDFVEKPSRPECVPGNSDSIFASMGIYLFKKDCLIDSLVQAVGQEGMTDFGRDIIPRMLNRQKVLAHIFEDENFRDPPYWRDIGTLDAFYEANMDLISVDPQFNLYDQHWPVRTHQRQFPPAKTVFADPGEMSRRGQVLDSLISSGAVVSGGRVERSILSPRVRINSYARVEDSILMDGVTIGRRARICRAIIDKYIEIEHDIVIGEDPVEDRKRFTVTDRGIVVIASGQRIGISQCSPLWVDPVQDRRSN